MITAPALKPLVMWRYGAGHFERDIGGPITPKLLKTPKSGAACLQTRGISVGVSLRFPLIICQAVSARGS